MFSNTEIILLVLCSVAVIACFVSTFFIFKLVKNNAEQAQLNKELQDKETEELRQKEEESRVKEAILNERLQDLNEGIKKAADLFVEARTGEKSTNEQLNLMGKNLMEKHDSSQESIANRLAEFNKAFNVVAELQNNVKGLNNLLENKQARGAFSEVFLNQLIQSNMAESQYSFQYQLSNNSRVDCALHLDHEGGKVMCVDSKFPLDSYDKYIKKEASLSDIKRDIKKHIKDISSKYIIHGETHDWALMFVPSEVIFSVIHNEMPDLVAFSFEHKVAITAPNSMMATIVTVTAAIRDYTFNKETLKIRDIFLDVLKEFERFNDRFEKIKGTHKRLGDEIENLNISNGKIKTKLEKVKNAKISE